MHNRTQKHVMQSWKRSESCVVSIVCTTYNHEQYIQETIDGFVMQETDFPFEIIIHDDASTDNTPNIIEEYYLRYPDIIRPIYQKENQYSKGGFKPAVHAASYARGKYIAICEGDDYWISVQKLQIQVEAMERHPEVDFSFHCAYRLRNEIREKNPFWDYGYERVLYPDSILSTDPPRPFAPTPSYLFRRDIFFTLPDWFYEIAPVGDYFLEMYGAKRGGALYINRPMSIYRVSVKNSWSANHTEGSIKYFQHGKAMLKSLRLLEKDFMEYKENINAQISVYLYNIAIYHLISKNDNLFRDSIEDSITNYSYFSCKQRILYKLRMLPFVFRLYYKFIVFIKRYI